MLELKRITRQNEVRVCGISGKYIVFGDWYYYDPSDGTIVKASEYNKLKNIKKEENFDYSLLQKAQNQQEYKELIKQAQKEYLQQEILEREIAKGGKIQKGIK